MSNLATRVGAGVTNAANSIARKHTFTIEKNGKKSTSWLRPEREKVQGAKVSRVYGVKSDFAINIKGNSVRASDFKQGGQLIDSITLRDGSILSRAQYQAERSKHLINIAQKNETATSQQHAALNSINNGHYVHRLENYHNSELELNIAKNELTKKKKHLQTVKNNIINGIEQYTKGLSEDDQKKLFGSDGSGGLYNECVELRKAIKAEEIEKRDWENHKYSQSNEVKAHIASSDTKIRDLQNKLNTRKGSIIQIVQKGNNNEKQVIDEVKQSINLAAKNVDVYENIVKDYGRKVAEDVHQFETKQSDKVTGKEFVESLNKGRIDYARENNLNPPVIRSTQNTSGTDQPQNRSESTNSVSNNNQTTGSTTGSSEGTDNSTKASEDENKERNIFSWFFGVPKEEDGSNSKDWAAVRGWAARTAIGLPIVGVLFAALSSVFGNNDEEKKKQAIMALLAAQQGGQGGNLGVA
ncbi:MAG: hypothetical protein QNJ31_06715 [Candidatus Caenarcaniphilales bacterium]|nr:hypothetical protein [Candidatus Caenarcaniphilales bacterium]